MTTLRLRIPRLPQLITGLKQICKVLAVAAPVVRNYVPEPSLIAYDAAVSAIMEACDVIRAIEFMDISAATNPPWGDRQ